VCISLASVDKHHKKVTFNHKKVTFNHKKVTFKKKKNAEALGIKGIQTFNFFLKTRSKNKNKKDLRARCLFFEQFGKKA